MATTSERWTPAGPIRSVLTTEAIDQEEGRAAASAADATPLGLFGFAAATFTVSTVAVGWFPTSTVLSAAIPLIVFGGIVQFVAAMWAFRKGDTLAATAFGSFGGFNATYGFYLVLAKAGLITGPGADNGVFGIFLICLGLIAGLLTLAAFWKNMALVGVLGTLMVAYVFFGISYLDKSSAMMLHIGGWAGLVTSVIAFYTGCAVVVNSLAARQILPLGSALRSGARAQSHATSPTVSDLERRTQELEAEVEQLRMERQASVSDLERRAR